MAGATTRLITQKGWSKSAVSDWDGHVSFQLVANHLPDWKEFGEDRRDRFVAEASYTALAKGLYQGHSYRTMRYVTTLSGSCYRARTAYRSHLCGRLVVLFAAVLSLCRLKHTMTARERYRNA